ncbi:retinoic acid-induced protein 2-like [Scleropages formosus]|uniref:Retinoic acid-induced protein 2-like n=1 Tax=Scleropages formosus TaxID=113540 RepID=A0A0P7U6M9_SCLFO|nr:retinoic acid-induced protein 2-like [Scleropages formosus]
MENGQPGLPLDTASPPAPVNGGGRGATVGEGTAKLENAITQLITAEAWNLNTSGLARKPLSPLVAVPAPSLLGSTAGAEPQGGMALKVAATVLQPICLGESPVVLPIHLQMAGSGAPPLGPAANASYLMAGQGPVSLPLVLEQQVFQHLSSPSLQQGAPCPAASLQNGTLCQNTSLPFTQPQPLDQKSSGQPQDPGVLPLLQNPAFAAILQDLFPLQNNLNSSACHTAASTPTDHFSSTFFPPPPPLVHPYSSPLSPLVPPATLLVPYPIIVPLPVPLPVPIPVPIPIPQNADSKVFVDPPKPTCTLSKGTQTNAKETTGPVRLLQSAAPSPPFPAEGEVLDLSVKVLPVQTKQEVPLQQDSVLDLSVASRRKACVQSFLSREPPGACRSAQDAGSAALSLEVLRPMECAQKLDSKLLSGLASLEFSRQHKWVVDGSGRQGGEPKGSGGGGNFEIGLSGVSTKNFSIKHDANQEAVLQQCFSARAPGELRGPTEALKKTSKNRAIKLKKVNSQEIHLLPIKKQRLAAFFPRK